MKLLSKFIVAEMVTSAVQLISKGEWCMDIVVIVNAYKKMEKKNYLVLKGYCHYCSLISKLLYFKFNSIF